MSESLGVGATAVSNSVVSGKFPPSWFVVMQALCKDAGIECPPSLFGMKSTNGVISVTEGLPLQGHSPENVGGVSK